MARCQLSDVTSHKTKRMSRIRLLFSAALSTVIALAAGGASASSDQISTAPSLESRIAAVRTAIRERGSEPPFSDQAPDQTYQWPNWNNWRDWNNWNNWQNWGNWGNWGNY